MLPIAAVTFLISFWIDKWMLLKFYEKPRSTDKGLAILSANLIPAALLLHLGMAIYMFGNSDTLPSNIVTVSKVSKYGGVEADDAKLVYLEFQKAVESFDPLGLLARSMRNNVFPISVMFAALFSYLILKTAIGALITGFLCSCMKKKNKVCFEFNIILEYAIDFVCFKIKYGVCQNP